MHDEYDNKPVHLCVMFPDGETHELQAESVELEPLCSDVESSFDMIRDSMKGFAANLEMNEREFMKFIRLLYRAIKVDMSMHHRRRFPWGRRFMSRKGRNGRKR